VRCDLYLWQGLTRLLAIYDGNNALQYRFTYADDRTPTNVTTAAATYYMHYDQVGTLRTVTDAAGAVVKEATYDSFGNVLSDSRPTMSHFAFAGGLYDTDTGLVRFGYRDYDANVGVRTAKDPIGFGGDDLILYIYCTSNPIINFDADGKISTTIARYVLIPLILWAAHEAIKSPQKPSKAKPFEKPIAPTTSACPRNDPDPEKERCKKIKDICIEKCSSTTIPTSDYGASFFKCLNRCMADNDC
jgi:RHS repeat-associated protein